MRGMVNLYKYKAYKKQLEKCECSIKRRKIIQRMNGLLLEINECGVKTDEIRRII